MRRISHLAGWAAAVFIVAGTLGYGVLPMFKGFYVIPWALAAVCLMLYLPYNLKTIKAMGASRAVRRGAGSAVGIALFCGIIIFVAILTSRHSIRWDLTENKINSLAPQTIQILQNLDQAVAAEGFYQAGGRAEQQARNLLAEYQRVTPQFDYEILDPDRHPTRAKVAGISKYDTLVLRSGESSEKITELSEEKLTNALLRITRPGRKTVYFLSGHGEKALDEAGPKGYSTISNDLDGQNYQVKKLLLMEASNIPSDAAVLVVAGPEKDPFPEELDLIDAYLKKGGRLLALIEPEMAPEFAAFLERYQVGTRRDIIVDKMSRLFGADYLMPLVAEYADHPVTKDFKLTSFFPLARSVTPLDKAVPGVKVETLARTSDQAWGETDLEALNKGTARFDQGVDLPGPVSVAVVGTVEEPEKEDSTGAEAAKPDVPGSSGKFIVFGDSDFASNAYVGLQGNGDLFMRAVSWLAEEGDLVALRAKDRKSEPLLLSQIQVRLVFWIPVVLMPLAVLICGLAVVAAGRKKR